MRRPTRLPALLVALALSACADGVGPNGPEALQVQFSVQPPAGVSAEETQAIDNAFDLVDTYRVTVRDSVTGSVIAADTVSVTPGGDEYRFDFTLSPDVLGLAVEVTVVGLDGGVELYRGSDYTRIQAGSSTTNPVPVVLAVRYTGPGIRGTVANDNGAGLSGVTVNLFQGASPAGTVVTEDDGTYLFLSPSTGPHTVEPSPPGGTFLCPGTRDLTVVAGSAIVADFTASSTPCQIDLLVLSGGDEDNTAYVANLFASSPGVVTDTYFYVNQAPGLSTLRQYDVVLLFNNGIFDETTLLGNQLREYVAVGGNVVIGSFYWQARGDSQFPTPGWGNLESVDPFLADTVGFTQRGGATYSANDLGTIALPSHPLIQGVSSLVSLAGFSAGVLAKVEATVVASWTDGAPLVGYRVLEGGQRIVAVSLFPAADDPTQVNGDVQVLWENAITWAGNAGGPIQ